jgi:hypothetical protein
MAIGQIDRVSTLHRTINLFVALALVALGAGGLIYFYFIAAWNGWMALAAGVVCAAGLYWLWDEHINVGPRPEH